MCSPLITILDLILNINLKFLNLQKIVIFKEPVAFMGFLKGNWSSQIRGLVGGRVGCIILHYILEKRYMSLKGLGETGKSIEKNSKKGWGEVN